VKSFSSKSNPGIERLVAGRDGVTAYIAAMKERQEKIRGLLSQGKNLEDIKKEFTANESGLVEIIFNEIKSGK
jgi:hypothetical protein